MSDDVQTATKITSKFPIERGDSLVLEMREVRDGFDFAVFSRHATQMTLPSFEVSGDEPVATVGLDLAPEMSGTRG